MEDVLQVWEKYRSSSMTTVLDGYGRILILILKSCPGIAPYYL